MENIYAHDITRFMEHIEAKRSHPIFRSHHNCLLAVIGYSILNKIESPCIYLSLYFSPILHQKKHLNDIF